MSNKLTSSKTDGLYGELTMQDRAALYEKRLSRQQLEVAQQFLLCGNLLNAVKSVKRNEPKTNIYTYRYQLARNSAFIEYVHFLRECQRAEVVIDRGLVLQKLQEEFFSATGKEAAELAKVINAMQGNAVDRKEITINIPGLYEKQLQEQPKKPQVEAKKDRQDLIKESEGEFRKLLNNVQEAEIIENK